MLDARHRDCRRTGLRLAALSDWDSVKERRWVIVTRALVVSADRLCLARLPCAWCARMRGGPRGVLVVDNGSASTRGVLRRVAQHGCHKIGGPREDLQPQPACRRTRS